MAAALVCHGRTHRCIDCCGEWLRKSPTYPTRHELNRQCYYRCEQCRENLCSYEIGYRVLTHRCEDCPLEDVDNQCRISPLSGQRSHRQCSIPCNICGGFCIWVCGHDEEDGDLHLCPECISFWTEQYQSPADRCYECSESHSPTKRFASKRTHETLKFDASKRARRPTPQSRSSVGTNSFIEDLLAFVDSKKRQLRFSAFEEANKILNYGAKRRVPK